MISGRLVFAALYCMAKGLHCPDFAVTRDCDLAGRQQTLVDFALRAFKEFVNFGGIEANFPRVLCNPMGCGHFVYLLS